MRHQVYFSPGMFGFAKIGSYDYFAHLREAISGELERRGHECATWVLDVQPTASIRRRAGSFAELVAATDDGVSAIHLVGHSTGGLDARMVASPSIHLQIPARTLAFLPRLRSITTLAAPHFGTPLASFFATVSGQRLLYAVSALTYVALSVGSPPLAAASALVAIFGRLDRAFGVDIRIVDRAIDALLTTLDDARSKDLRDFLDAITMDQGAIIQVSPEAMDLFRAGVENRPGTLYQCVVGSVPKTSPLSVLGVAMAPWTVVSRALFLAMSTITGRVDPRYPCGSDELSDAHARELARVFGTLPAMDASDGVVPTRSQLWGEIAWAGYADHLDILGHFRDDRPTRSHDVVYPHHRDWMASGAGFDRSRFGMMVRAVVDGIVRSAAVSESNHEEAQQ